MDGEYGKQGIYAAVSGSIYCIFGLAQIVAWFGIDALDIAFMDSNALGGLVLILIGIVFLYGARDIRSSASEGRAYIFVATLLGLLFMGVFILVLAANGLDAAFAGEAYDIGADIIPLVYLGLLPLFGYIGWHKEFSISNFSRAGV